jgi:hypothetical protein
VGVESAGSDLPLLSILAETKVAWDFSVEYVDTLAVDRASSKHWILKLPALFLNSFFFSGEAYACWRNFRLRGIADSTSTFNQFFQTNRPKLLELGSGLTLPWSKIYTTNYLTRDFSLQSLDYFFD